MPVELVEAVGQDPRRGERRLRSWLYGTQGTTLSMRYWSTPAQHELLGAALRDAQLDARVDVRDVEHVIAPALQLSGVAPTIVTFAATGGSSSRWCTDRRRGRRDCRAPM